MGQYSVVQVCFLLDSTSPQQRSTPSHPPPQTVRTDASISVEYNLVSAASLN